MGELKPDDAVAVSRRAAPVGAVTTRGAAWTVGLTVLAKVFGTVGQLLLALLLTQDDFGLYAISLTFPGIGAVLCNLGLRQVLVDRQKRWRVWVNAAFWMSLLGGVAGFLVTLALTPVAMWVYGESLRLGVLMWCVAGASLATALGTVPEARLQTQLRFRAGAVIGWVSVVGALVLSVLMAWGGWGAFSFGIPYLLAAVFRTSAFWWLARPEMGRGLQLRRWKYMLADTTYLTAANATYLVTQRADFYVLGALYPKAVVGTYSFAQNLASQTMQLLVTNLQSLLFAALNKLKDEPTRQAQGFLRASRVLLSAGAMLAVMQAAAAEPAIRLVYADKWADAIGIVQLLSVGSILGLMYAPAGSLLQAQGRFKTTMWLTFINAAVLIVSVALGASLGEGMGAAAGFTVYWAVTAVVMVKAGLGRAIRWAGRDSLLSLFGVPLAVGLPAGCVAYLATWAIPDTRLGHFVACLVVVVLTPPLYLLLLRLGFRAWYDELMTVLQAVFAPVLGRFRRSGLPDSGSSPPRAG